MAIYLSSSPFFLKHRSYLQKIPYRVKRSFSIFPPDKRQHCSCLIAYLFSCSAITRKFAHLSSSPVSLNSVASIDAPPADRSTSLSLAHVLSSSSAYLPACLSLTILIEPSSPPFSVATPTRPAGAERRSLVLFCWRPRYRLTMPFHYFHCLSLAPVCLFSHVAILCACVIARQGEFHAFTRFHALHSYITVLPFNGEPVFWLPPLINTPDCRPVFPLHRLLSIAVFPVCRSFFHSSTASAS